ncbi:MAG TPA: hypothetical protein VNP03_00905 [Pseudonocardia sp.]|nr:hypothetical protein [Pseudonocardia sp.]
MVPTTNPELAAANPLVGGGRHRRAPEPLGRQLLAAGFELSGYLGRTVSALVALAVLGSIAAAASPAQRQEPAGPWSSATHSAMAEVTAHGAR